MAEEADNGQVPVKRPDVGDVFKRIQEGAKPVVEPPRKQD